MSDYTIAVDWAGKDNYLDGGCNHCALNVTFYHIED